MTTLVFQSAASSITVANWRANDNENKNPSDWPGAASPPRALLVCSDRGSREARSAHKTHTQTRTHRHARIFNIRWGLWPMTSAGGWRPLICQFDIYWLAQTAPENKTKQSTDTRHVVAVKSSRERKQHMSFVFKFHLQLLDREEPSCWCCVSLVWSCQALLQNARRASVSTQHWAVFQIQLSRIFSWLLVCFLSTPLLSFFYKYIFFNSNIHHILFVTLNNFKVSHLQKTSGIRLI